MAGLDGAPTHETALIVAAMLAAGLLSTKEDVLQAIKDVKKALEE